MVRNLSEIRENYLDKCDLAGEQGVRLAGVAAAELFTAFSLARAVFAGDTKSVPVCLITFILILLPGLCERIFHCHIRTEAFLLCILYALCSMAGNAYQMYDRIPVWDKMLHTTGGIVFAMFGAYLPYLLNKDHKPSLLMCAVFAVCFSITVSALWEFYEFGADQLFGLDMQRDTFITAIDSRLLGGGGNTVGRITDIENVTVNGAVLEGYIDIGLIDTMMDMLVETLGALCYVAFYLITKGEKPAFSPAEAEA